LTIILDQTFGTSPEKTPPTNQGKTKMKRREMPQSLLVLFVFSAALATESKVSLIEKKETRFLNIRQLTFAGENAEAYFSLDGKNLIFQAHEGDSLCDQIYTMELSTGETKRVSTGNGVTTCGYFEYPDCKNILYASTHLGGTDCPPKPDHAQGYVWKLYPDYDIFHSTKEGEKIKRLTDSPGYDAEATVAFDGSRVLYTSMVSGDLDIWSMNIDGSNKTQLTDRMGYDGGAFFNSQATRIVWRVYHPKTQKEVAEYKSLLSENTIRPMALQLWTMNTDGTNKQQVTNNDAANFGPYFFPDGNKIIFSSNLHDPSGRDFDLYAIGVEGTNLERITFFNGFDGFPMFSPNGKFLVFASNRNQAKRGDTNLFITEWNYR